MKDLPAYEITYQNGQKTRTSMAADVTLKQAQEYFIGERFDHIGEKIRRTNIHGGGYPIRYPGRGVLSGGVNFKIIKKEVGT